MKKQEQPIIVQWIARECREGNLDDPVTLESIECYAFPSELEVAKHIGKLTISLEKDLHMFLSLLDGFIVLKSLVLDALCPFPPVNLPQLQFLELENMLLFDNHFRLMPCLTSLEVSLRDNNVRTSALSFLRDIKCLSQLINLKLINFGDCNNDITKETMNDSLYALVHLQILKLYDTEISFSQLYLAPFQLKVLYFHKCMLNDFIQPINWFEQITSFNASGSQMTDATAVKLFNRLKSMPQLEHLDVRNNKIVLQGFKTLVANLQDIKLTYLFVAGNPFATREKLRRQSYYLSTSTLIAKLSRSLPHLKEFDLLPDVAFKQLPTVLETMINVIITV
jgi:hypothetical protein